MHNTLPAHARPSAEVSPANPKAEAEHYHDLFHLNFDDFTAHGFEQALGLCRRLRSGKEPGPGSIDRIGSIRSSDINRSQKSSLTSPDYTRAGRRAWWYRARRARPLAARHPFSRAVVMKVARIECAENPRVSPMAFACYSVG